MITCGSFDSNDTNILTIMTERQRYDYGHMPSMKIRLQCILYQSDCGAEHGNFKFFGIFYANP